mmetsp:Transcript_14764/g.28048  ORF Transcript_14764/g.28048 Transcript_14764/m.28048 type:complete len:131 (+) Transcript_14764:129-521(+)
MGREHKTPSAAMFSPDDFLEFLRATQCAYCGVRNCEIPRSVHVVHPKNLTQFIECHDASDYSNCNSNMGVTKIDAAQLKKIVRCGVRNVPMQIMTLLSLSHSHPCSYSASPNLFGCSHQFLLQLQNAPHL